MLRRAALSCLWLSLGLRLVAPSGAWSQTVRLVDSVTGSDRIAARLGDVISVDAVADLGAREISAVSLYISLPADPFLAVDVSAAAGTQPFTVGSLFSGAVVAANLAVSTADTPDVFAGLRLLDFAAAVRAGDNARSGSGVVATFQLRCVREAENIVIAVDVNPVRESFVVRADLRDEERFRVTAPLFVSIRGLDLLDIPDVRLLPGQIDSTRIGGLDKYVVNNIAPVDSLRWSVSGAEPESLRVEITPGTRRVRVTPLGAFRGRRTVTFTAREPRAVIGSDLPPSASETAEITVNTPARFTIRRDTVRVNEDAFTYVVSSLAEPQPARAFRGRDLDLLVADPEVPEARRHTAYRYATATYRPGTDTLRQVRGRVDPVTHELLVWSRPSFSGIDSFRVLVADEFTIARSGGDSLRIVVVVDEVPDAPRFLLDDVIRLQASTEHALAVRDLIFDPDTPLTDLELTWTPDFGGQFSLRRDADSLRFRAPGYAAQGLFVLTVSDPDGLSARLTQRVTATAVPPDSIIVPGAPDFRLLPLPDLTVDLGEAADVATLDDHLVLEAGVRADQITWSVFTLDEDISALASVRPDRHLLLQGLASGVDTLVVSARGPRGRVRQDTTLISVTSAPAASRTLRLLPMPDVNFVAGHAFVAFDLDDFVADRVTHPDSLVSWSASFLGAASMIVQVRNDRTVFVAASDSTEVRVVFRAENLLLHVSGRDTVRFSAAAARYARLPLTLPDLDVAPGMRDSLDLDAFLPAAISAVDTSWTVSGQRLVQAVINPAPPHRMLVTAPGAQVGDELLSLRVNLGRGFGARGTVRVRVAESVRDDDFRVVLLPNPVAPDNVGVYIVSRWPLRAKPAVTRTVGDGPATPVAVGEAIIDLTRHGALVWSGVTRLPRRTAGAVSLGATATTQRGTALAAVARLVYGQVRAGRPLTLRLGEVAFELPADAAAAAELIVLTLAGGAVPEHAEASGVRTPSPELIQLSSVALYPPGLGLRAPGRLYVGGPAIPGVGLYRETPDGAWTLRGLVPGAVEVTTLAPHAVLLDTLSPTLGTPVQIAPGRFRATATDGGSGVDSSSVQVTADGMSVSATLLDDRLDWVLPVGLANGEQHVVIRLADRVGNEIEGVYLLASPPLPRLPHLGAAYPNPFNPSTQVPFTVPGGNPVRVRLGVFDVAGQRVRRLVDDQRPPGHHAVTFDGRDDEGRRLASGVYLIHMRAGGVRCVRRVALLR